MTLLALNNWSQFIKGDQFYNYNDYLAASLKKKLL